MAKSLERSAGHRAPSRFSLKPGKTGRRNLSPDARRVMLGRVYNRRKQAGAGAPAGNVNAAKQLRQLDAIDSERTSAAVGVEFGVSPRTVERAGAAAEAIAGTPLEAAVMQGQARLAEAVEIARTMREERPGLAGEATAGARPWCAVAGG